MVFSKFPSLPHAALHYTSAFLRRPLFRIVTFSLALLVFLYLFLPPTVFPYGEYHPEGHHFLDDYSPPPRHPRPPPHRHGHGGGPHRPHKHDASTDLWASRAAEVKGAFVDAYTAYKEHASGHDELLPLTNAPVDNFNGWGLTVVESLDTMWLMGLYDEFDEALSVVANTSFALQPDKYAPFFETVIRYLGGLLSAYALSDDPIFLARADELGTMLLPAFNTPSGMPMYAVNTVTSSLKVEHLMEIMYKTNTSATHGLFPTKWDTHDGTPRNQQLSVGAFADSAYEYMLKQYLLTGRTDIKARDLYINSANAIISTLIYLDPTRGLLYVTDTDGSEATPSHTFEHLSCFLPGVLALGAHTLPLARADRERHLRATCSTRTPRRGSRRTRCSSRTAARRTRGGGPTRLREWEDAGRPGGVPPGVGAVKPAGEREAGGAGARGYGARAGKAGWLLRPEAVESFYVMWRVTGERKWRERGWEVFEAVQREAKVRGDAGSGYASLKDVYEVGAERKDEMPSYFLAETLKYLYLLFTNEELVPLDQWVFNTEAHPLPVFQWSEWEKARYGIVS
ncbi:glycoside hydrolase family 47 protein [Heterobasidion irregulare TC 32-1]|uniref:alpha-1,2-Mannosidase n=1 Tax=Heterobasidion irregulare (strain TC 32-1) TaxID=747525 RepID=W4JZ38_HETIT|nr:glycoside hydrolase family 47 protein [Heterobasidion irregulare TC 32-1]ETW78797.1 glycoside hydrolase family 47 protein [Heterobasidion irregulare TC 32-1]